MENTPLVSIVIRTCGRPYILKYALDSIRVQTYSRIEVIVVEDGKNCSQEFLEKNYKDLNIKYYASEYHIGRSAIGNYGLTMCTGKYINFLDDDDLFYSDHIAVLVKTLEENGSEVAYTVASECKVKKINKPPYYIKLHNAPRLKQPFNRALLMNKNYLPIQSIMFRRSIYERMGGFDEKLDQLEDWDLWVRFATKVDFIFINKVTSEYKVPCIGRKSQQRERELMLAYQTVCSKFKDYYYDTNAFSVGRDIEYLLADYRVPWIWKKIRMVKNLMLYGNTMNKK